MEGNLPSDVMIHGSSYAMLDLENHMNNQVTCNQQHNQMNGYILNTSNNAEAPLMGRNPTSDEDDHIYVNEDEHNNRDGNVKAKKGFRRMKWTDVMIRLLITAVSYIGEDADCSGAAGRKSALLLKKGKWKAISKALEERGFSVSPQQCEDKFNDLNKRFKRLTELLGRGTCQVVENNELLDTMENLSEKAKEDVRKILSSRHLFYEEMCSYHNGSRFKLPPDPALHKSLQLALESKEECNNGGKKRRRDDHDVGHEDVDSDVDMDQFVQEDEHHIDDRRAQIEERRLQIKAAMIELKHQKQEWLKASKEEDKELDEMRADIKRMKLENKRLALELKVKKHNH